MLVKITVTVKNYSYFPYNSSFFQSGVRLVAGTFKKGNNVITICFTDQVSTKLGVALEPKITISNFV